MEIAALVGGITTLVGAFLSIYTWLRIEASEGTAAGESPQQRADRLSQALREAVDVIEEFRAEIAQGQQTADRLQMDIERYEELARLGREDMEAVARVLRTELQEESGRSFRRDLTMNGGFLILGAGLSLLLTSLIGG